MFTFNRIAELARWLNADQLAELRVLAGSREDALEAISRRVRTTTSDDLYDPSFVELGAMLMVAVAGPEAGVRIVDRIIAREQVRTRAIAERLRCPYTKPFGIEAETLEELRNLAANGHQEDLYGLLFHRIMSVRADQDTSLQLFFELGALLPLKFGAPRPAEKIAVIIARATALPVLKVE